MFYIPIGLKNKQKGFTLVELLVVIAIIGILSAVVLASLNSARQKGRDAKRIGDMGQVKIALELYFDDNSSSYPTTAQGIAQLVTNGYLPAAPLDPINTGNYVYSYRGIGTPALSYVLYVDLEGTSQVLTGGGDVDGVVDTDVTCDDPTYCLRP